MKYYKYDPQSFLKAENSAFKKKKLKLKFSLRVNMKAAVSQSVARIQVWRTPCLFVLLGASRNEASLFRCEVILSFSFTSQ